MKKQIRMIAASLALVFLVGLLPMGALAMEDIDGEQETAAVTLAGDADAALAPTSDPDPQPETCTVTVNVKYVAFSKYDSGGSHYDKASVTDGEAQVFTCTPGEANTLELELPDDGYVVEASFLNGNTNTSVARGMDGSTTLTTTPTKDASITVKVGLQWTSRVYVYNMVLADGTYGYQFPGVTSATVLLPKGGNAGAGFAASDARDAAYLDGNLQPAISGSHADYEYSGRYYVSYYDGDTGTNTIVADSASGLDDLASYDLQIDSATGKITSVDGQTSPTLTGNQYFSVLYYFNRPGEAEQGNIYTYSFYEDPAGAFSYGDKKYRIDAEHVGQVKQDIGRTYTYEVPGAEGFVYSGSQLYQFSTANKWELQRDGAFDFTASGNQVSVTTQRGYLAFYNYYDKAGAVTVNRVYDSAYSADPVFDGQNDYTDSSAVQTALGGSYTVDSTGAREGYAFVPAMTKVDNGDFTLDESGNVVLTAVQGGETVTYYYYRQLQHTPDPGGPSVYRVTVKYVDMDGKTLEKDSVTRLNAGSKYDVSAQAAKAIEGYEIDHVDGETKGTLNASLTVTVYYRADSGDKPQEPGTEVPEEEVPKTDLPETAIPEGDVPTSDLPDTATPEPSRPEDTVIEEQQPPLGNLPQTGSVDPAMTLGAAALALSLALAGGAVALKKKEQ